MKSLKIFCFNYACLILLLTISPVLGQESLSPAEQKIAWARKAIEANQGRYELYNELALALARRGRETSDTIYYKEAEEALEHSFRLAPDNLEGRKMEIWILLGKHEFAQALKKASMLNQQVPDDIMVYGFLTDANMELGNYREAESAAQWMLDMRPGNILGLTRAAYLREIFGDIDGAVDLLDAAYQRTPAVEIEDRAWILTHIAHLQLMAGKVENADKLLSQALALFPGYHYALGNLAKVRNAQKKYSETIDLLRQRYQFASHPENLYPLAEALEQSGRVREAKRAYREFERKARAEIQDADNSNRELIFYYIDHFRKPSEALRIAETEIARRHDIYTLDAYAWALYANRKYVEARQQIKIALSVGIRDAKVFYHAAAIALKLKDKSAAMNYLQQSLELNPFSEVASAAKKTLVRLRNRENKRKTSN